MKELFIETPSAKYPIYIDNNFDGLCNAFKKAGLEGRKLCIITETNVEKVYLQQIKDLLSKEWQICSYTFKAGEESKTLDTIRDFYNFFLEEKLDRKSVLIALGGGVTGDMTGFAAATYMRGIPFVQIPTTLLSQVDSSVGGKTGVDFLGNKNMIGAFYQPHFVYINQATLKTLPSEQVAAGMAEAVKYGYIIERDFVDYFKDNLDALNSLSDAETEYIIYTSCMAKAYVVNKDEKESGLREILNFGHTFGHAIEMLSGFSLLHGECVAIGMVAALHLCRTLGKVTTEELRQAEEILTGLHLPIRAKGFDAKAVYNQMFYDKKTKNGKLNIVLLNQIGSAYTEKAAPEAAVMSAIEYICKGN